jgi:dihydrodipicolinate synthase/N-acetylneuraminate lyase
MIKTRITSAICTPLAGVKCSAGWAQTQQLMEHTKGTLRLIPAEPLRIVELIEFDVRENLDGVYALVPDFTMSIVRSAEDGDRDAAMEKQKVLSDFLDLLCRNRVFPAVSEFFKIRSIPEHVTVAPHQPLSEEEQTAFREDPALKRILDAC